MREVDTFSYIQRKYPSETEIWKKVTRLVKFDENFEIKSVHYFD